LELRRQVPTTLSHSLFSCLSLPVTQANRMQTSMKAVRSTASLTPRLKSVVCSAIRSTSAVPRPLSAKPLSFKQVGTEITIRKSTRISARNDQKNNASGDNAIVYNTEFGHSRKDVLLIGVGLTALGYAMYYGVQALGVEAAMAGSYVQLIIFVGICVFWVSTYVFRVATKKSTYVKQLEEYEDAVMRKRLDEMTDAELNAMVADSEAEGSMKRK
jgi:hypothetical protein